MPDLQGNPENIGYRTRPIAVPEVDVPTRGETFLSGWRTASDDIEYVQRARRNAAYSEIVERLREQRGMGIAGAFAYTNPARLIPVAGIFVDEFDGEAVWRDIRRARIAAINRGEADPWADLPASQEEFEQMIATRERGVTRGLVDTSGATRADDLDTLGRSPHWLTALGGGFGSQVLDPLNVATAPIGGASNAAWQAVYRGFVINAAIETVQQPFLAAQRERMGEELTLTEVGINIGLAGAFGGALGGAGHVLSKNWDAIKALPQEAQQRIWSAISERSPRLRERAGATVDWDALDAMLPEVVDDLGRAGDLPDEVRGAQAMQREAELIASANPYADDAAGRRAFHNELAIGMRQVMDDAPAQPVRPMPSGAPAPQRDSGTAIAGGAVGSGPRSELKRRIGRVESGGNDAARNPRSSATGRYQFISETWVRLYKNRYGARGQSDEQIAALRGDVRLQERLMDDLVEHNERALIAAGIEPTAGNLYLAHFAGDAGARRLHRAPPDASAQSVLGEAVIDANPFLRGWSARDVIAWAHRKMGGAAPAPRDDPAPGNLRSELQEEIERLAVERQAIFDRVVEDMQAVPESALDLPARRDPLSPDDDLPEMANDILEDLRAVAQDYRTSLSDLDGLARRLGAERADLDIALDRLVGQGELRRTKKGKLLRPRRTQFIPSDYIGQLAFRGGIEPNGLGAKEVERLVREGTPIEEIKGHDLRNSGNFNHFVPGVGPLLRPGGRGLDEIGLELHEMGVFGNVELTPRPTERQVMEWLDDVLRNKRKIDMATGLDMEADSADWQARGFADEADYRERREAADFAARAALGRELTNEEFDKVHQLEAQSLGMFDPDTMIAQDWLEERYASAILAVVERDIDEVLDWAYIETEDADYDFDTGQFARQDASPVEGDTGRAPDPGDAGGGAGGIRPGESIAGPERLDEIPPPLSPEDYLAFQDIDGPGVQAHAESLIHDLRVEIAAAAPVDPPVSTAGPVIARLEADGWARDGLVFSKRIDGFSEAGSVSDGARLVRLRLDDRERYLERVDGWGNVENDIDLRAFDDPDVAIRTVLGARGDDPAPALRPLITGERAGDFAAPTAAQVRTALERQTEGGIRPSGPQRAPGEDGGLFDTRDTTADAFEGLQFRLDDGEDVAPMTARDLLDDIDADETMLKNIKDCL